MTAVSASTSVSTTSVSTATTAQPTTSVDSLLANLWLDTLEVMSNGDYTQDPGQPDPCDPDPSSSGLPSPWQLISEAMAGLSASASAATPAQAQQFLTITL